MLTTKEILELRDALKTAKKPIIFFDDDTDGLSSFLLFYHYLKKYTDDIRGIIVKSSPILKDDVYIRRIQEYNPDKVFVLDKPMIHQDFIDKIKIPIYWLDHHPIQNNSRVHYFNPLKHEDKKYKPDNRPTTYWAYKVTEEPKHLMWIAMVGCIGDWFIPEFYKEFIKEYPDLWNKGIKIKNPGTVLHEMKQGKLCRIIQFNMKGTSKEIQDSIRVMKKITTPYDILDKKTPEGKFIYKHYEKVNLIYEKIKSNIRITDDKIILFIYNDKYVLTGELSNEIQYYNPDKLIVIAREKTEDMICSLRSENLNVRKILEEALIGIEGYGGGHEHACGCSVKKKDFDKFITNLREKISE